MPFLPINAVDCLALSLFLYLFVAFRDHRTRRGLSYPPGPPSWPIIGNLLDVPKEAPWIAYANMSKRYGDILYLRVFGQVVVVLSSYPAIKDLLDKRGETYADRPNWPITEITNTDWILPAARKGIIWREGRKLLNRSLRPGATISYRHMMLENTREFLARLLASPDEFLGHIGLLRGKLIMSLTYGYDLKNDDDDMIAVPVQLSKILARFFIPGMALVNSLPFLKYIPSWVPWLSYGPVVQKARGLSERMKNDPINFVKNAMHEGTARTSLARQHLQEIESLTDSERQKEEEFVKITLGSMYSAGSGATIASITLLFLALVLNPQVQKRAQAELDAVVGRDRLPTFDDRPRLSYIEAICREVFRWQVITPIGIPHASCEDDVYKGYFIPKGSIVVANAWAILHNPEIYPDPEEFKPERFLDKGGSFREDPRITLAFGAGKRICPGREFAEAALFIVASSVLSVFNLAKAKDENGYDIPVKVGTVDQSGLLSTPEAFRCSISPRDKAAEDLISASVLS